MVPVLTKKLISYVSVKESGKVELVLPVLLIVMLQHAIMLELVWIWVEVSSANVLQDGEA